MRCPHCQFEGSLVDGMCVRCGYLLVSVAQRTNERRSMYMLTPTAVRSSPLPPLNSNQNFSTTQHLRQGRYRIRERVSLPDNQRAQGEAWLALDTHARPERLVIVRSIRFPASSPQNAQTARAIALHHSNLGQHPALPNVIDVFEEDQVHYIVFQQTEGHSLSVLLKENRGSLPERILAEYGRQICEVLTIFSRQRPPYVHGSISPETIIVSPDSRKVSLIHLPLFAPNEMPVPAGISPSPYSAPEQVRGNTIPASDLYCVAAVMHHAVTGYDPRQRLNFFYPAARRLNPKVTPRMEEILARELHLSLSQRYSRPADMQTDLNTLLASYPLSNEDMSEPEIPVIVSSRSQLSSTQLRQWSRNRALVRTSIIGLFSLLLLALLSVPLLFPLLAPTKQAQQEAQQKAAWNVQMQLEVQTYEQKHIGISGGMYPFDVYPGRDAEAVKFKKQAAEALQKGDLSTAADLYTRVVAIDPTDGEALIYNENVQLLQNGDKYVTLALSLAFGEVEEDIVNARSNSQAAFLAQYEINRKALLPNGLKLRIVIVSCGSDYSKVQQVTQFVANRVKAGNPENIIGMVGWPFSSQSLNSLSTMASVRLPMISQSASSVKLTNANPYFFRVNPPDDAQGSALALVASDEIQATKVLVMRDRDDPYSNSLADAFSSEAKKRGLEVINDQQDYFTESKTTVEEFQQIVRRAAANGVDLVHLAGFSSDAVRLARAIGLEIELDPFNPYLINMKILGGDGLDTSLALGIGSGPDAQLAQANPKDMQRLIFSSFGHIKEWDLLKIPKEQQPAFFANWINFYQSSGMTERNAASPGSAAILTADAVMVFARAMLLVNGPLTGDSVRNALTSLGKGSVPPYQGISGRILFNEQGNPIDKALVILGIEPNEQGINVIILKKVVRKFK